jgi:hypothetical protein
VEIKLWKGTPAVYYYYAGANSSAENPSPESYPSVPGRDPIMKNFVFKMKFKLNQTSNRSV